MAGRQLTEIEKMVQNPRKVVLVNVFSGVEVDAWDDGASVTADGVFPSGRRQALLIQLGKFSRGYDNDKSKPKERVFILKEAVKPLFNGDPVAATPVLDAAWKKKIDANIAIRDAKMNAHLPAIKAEVSKLTKTAGATA